MKKISILLIASLLLAFTASAGYKVGDEVNDFALKNIDGQTISLKSYNTAKGFIVIFTCNHCPFAKAYEDRIIHLDRKYAEKGYPVIAINPNDVTQVPDDSYDNMVERAKEKKFTFPYLIDESQEIATKYGAARTPHVFIIQNVNGKYLVRYIGAIDNNSDDESKVTSKFVEDAVDALLSGKTVPVAETKAIGCTIKWKQK